MHESAMIDVRRFAETYLDVDRPCKIADVGSYDVNGNARSVFANPLWQYFGLDVVPGPNVDHVIWPDWVNIDLESFDVIVSISTMEHIAKPWEWIKLLSSRLKPGGLVYINAPNTWSYHEHPIDCWRVWPVGMKAILDEGGIVPLEVYASGSDTTGIGQKSPVCDDARIRSMYANAARIPSDINEHVPYLRELARQARTITEFGTRTGVSTVAFLAGNPDRLTCYDLELTPNALDVWANSQRVTMHKANVLDVAIDAVDLLFIDTFHTYSQLQSELRLHADKANRWIVLHDTTTFGIRGEDGGVGLWPAVEEFLQSHPEWEVERKVEFNNGLTTLRRLSTPLTHEPSPVGSGNVINIASATDH